MEYERIHKIQTGIISPTKLRMKLIGPHHRKKDGSNSNSSRTSPSKLEDSEFVNNSLLAPTNGDFDYGVTSPSLEVSSVEVSGEAALDPRQGDASRVGMQQRPKGESTVSSTIHHMRAIEDENLDYDSNASSSSFEFHKGERFGHNLITRSLSRAMPYKWNDAEKWIMNRQNVHQTNYSKKNGPRNNGYRMPAMNMVRVAPESINGDPKISTADRVVETKRVEFRQPGSHTGFEKLSIDIPADKKASTEDTAVGPAVRSVSMRDMGTEMTPVASQEPSRTTTPLEASPFRSPTSSLPSTPRGPAPAGPTPNERNTGEELQHLVENSKKELTEEELKLKTRREIVALGMRLGKMNIAAWASKEEQEKDRSAQNVEKEILELLEFEKRAAVWEDAEKSKHMARYKREEIKIQEWESQQKAKLEADVRKIEVVEIHLKAQVEQVRAEAEAKMKKKMAMARQRSEEKRAAAESRRNQDAERSSAQAEYIRQTGQMPSSSNYLCCGWLR